MAPLSPSEINALVTELLQGIRDGQLHLAESDRLAVYLEQQIYDLYAQKISDITNIPYPYIIALRDNGLLNQKEARDKLIRHDYWKLMKTNKFTHNQILEKLSGIYDVNKRKILYAIKVKPKRVYYCRQCGLQLSKVKYMRNDGICDKCISKQIKL